MPGQVEVVEPGPLTTIQDLGRVGHAALGVPTSGAVDRMSHNRANRLVGNDRTAATLEATFGGLALRALSPLWAAVTGAQAQVSVDGVPRAGESRFFLAAGQLLRVGVPTTGIRSYVAFRGGIAVPQTLGSRSTDTLAGLGPAPLAAGQVLPVGSDVGDFPTADHVPVPAPTHGPLSLPAMLGPRDDWFTDASIGVLRTGPWTVNAASNRIGVRLDGPTLERRVRREMPSEGVPVGAIQVPPSGPIVFLDDHPVTGGYPVIGVVSRRGVDQLAQASPGQQVTFDVVSHVELTTTGGRARDHTG